MTVNPYLHGNYAPVLEECSDDHELPVTGYIPPDLDGRLLRNGPNPAVVPADESDYHWFSGDGMIHAITLGGGKALGYRNRWVRTRALATKLGTVAPKGPREPIDGPANTHVIRHAGTTLALAESGFPHALSADLAGARVYDFDGGLASPMTAHPKIDPDTGDLIFFGCDVFGPPFLRYHVVDATGSLVRSEDVDVPRATLMHDFGVTATRVVFLDLPVLFDLELAAVGRSLPYRWMPEAGARVGVMPRWGGRADIHWVGIDPVYALHVLNAYDDGDSVVMDVVCYDGFSDTEPGQAIASGLPSLARWSIDPVGDRVTEERLDDAPVDLPRVDDEVAGRRHRYGYCTGLGTHPDRPAQPGLVKYDLQRDEATRFDPGEHRSPGEAVFVRAIDGRAEDEGWVLSVVFDAARGASDLVILDGTAFTGPPVATVHLPARVPNGFHGSWVPTNS
jgi:carotenoid cleavage dioxygenase-like enzyme